MKKLIILLSMLTLTIGLNAFAEGTRAGGGDMVQCHSNRNMNLLNGSYSLDYVQTSMDFYYRSGFEEDWFNSKLNGGPLTKVTKPLSIIQKRLKSINPAMAKDLNNFILSFKKKKLRIGSKLINWYFLPSKEIPEIKDEYYIKELPPNCFIEKNLGVRVVDLKGNIKYFVDKNKFSKIKKKKIQASMFLIHEWLRSYISNSSDIYIVSSFLHSKSFFRSKVSEVKKDLDFHLKGISSLLKNKISNKTLLASKGIQKLTSNSEPRGNIKALKKSEDPNGYFYYTLDNPFFVAFIDYKRRPPYSRVRLQRAYHHMLSDFKRYNYTDKEKDFYLESIKKIHSGASRRVINLAIHLMREKISLASRLPSLIYYGGLTVKVSLAIILELKAQGVKNFNSYNLKNYLTKNSLTSLLNMIKTHKQKVLDKISS